MRPNIMQPFAEMLPKPICLALLPNASARTSVYRVQTLGCILQPFRRSPCAQPSLQKSCVSAYQEVVCMGEGGRIQGPAF